jgi:hypothetical protein
MKANVTQRHGQRNPKSWRGKPVLVSRFCFEFKVLSGHPNSLHRYRGRGFWVICHPTRTHGNEVNWKWDR